MDRLQGPQNKRGRVSRMSSAASGVAESWADLPPEVLLSIGKRLETTLDVSSFVSVCKKWRSSLRVPSAAKPKLSGILSPFLPLPISNSASLPFNCRPNEPLILVASAVFLVQRIDSDPNSKGWLLTVEERQAGKLRILHPLSQCCLNVDLPSDFPKCLSLFKFRVTELAKSYSFKFASDGKDVYGIKVVLCSSFSISDCTAMVLYGKGVLIGVRVSDGQWGYVRQSLISPFENVSNYKNRVCALDVEGNVYAVDYMLMKVTNTIVRGESLTRQGLRSLKHHLVESNENLYLVVWGYCSSDEAFKVYKLNEGQQWVCVETFDNGVLFVSPDWCFFVFNYDRIRFEGKAIVYPLRLGCSAADVSGRCWLFQGYSVDLSCHLLLDKIHDKDRVSHSFKRDMADMMWPPPTWFWPDTFSSIREEHEEGQSDFQNHHSPTSIDDGPRASKDQDIKSDVLEGLDIRPDLVPILRKVWTKHGNILEGSNVHSKYITSCALESLANVIIILEGNSGRTLTEVQCNDITSTLCDLQHLSVRVEWLVPVVEKAVAVYISKPMIDAVAELEKAIARAKKVKMKFSNDLANMDEIVKALEKDRICLSERMPIPGTIDLDQCLAKGLF